MSSEHHAQYVSSRHSLKTIVLIRKLSLRTQYSIAKRSLGVYVLPLAVPPLAAVSTLIDYHCQVSLYLWYLFLSRLDFNYRLQSHTALTKTWDLHDFELETGP